MTESEFSGISELLNRVVWSEANAEACGMRFVIDDEDEIRSVLSTCGYTALVSDRRRRDEQASRERVAKAVIALLSELDRQRRFPYDSPKREGLETVAMACQPALPDGPQSNWNAHYEARRQLNRPSSGLGMHVPADKFITVGSYDSIGSSECWLELVLSETLYQLAPDTGTRKRRGARGKKSVRDYLWTRLTELFERRGGDTIVYRDAITNAPRGLLIDFISIILEQCPQAIREYFATGMPFAVKEWIDRGRPPSDQLHDLRLA